MADKKAVLRAAQAHNGTMLDEPVLRKEIGRLQVNMSGCWAAHLAASRLHARAKCRLQVRRLPANFFRGPSGFREEEVQRPVVKRIIFCPENGMP